VAAAGVVERGLSSSKCLDKAVDEPVEFGVCLPLPLDLADVFVRYIATCRGKATAFELFLALSSVSLML